MNNKIILQGGGEHARVVLDSLLSQQVEVCGLFDPKYHDELFGVKQRGVYDPSFEPDAKAIVAIGNNHTRKKVVGLTRHEFGNCIDRSAIVSPFAQVGEGAMVLHRVVVQAGSRLGKHVILNTGATVDHDCVIEDFVHIAPGVTLCGTVKIGEGTLIGAGSVVLPGVKMGKWSVVGAGSVVTKDVPDRALVVGNPAMFVRIISGLEE